MADGVVTDSRYDRDPEALAWAAAKVEKALERVENWAKDAKTQGDWARAKGLGVAALSIRGQLLGRGPCVIGAFDQRRVAIAAAMDLSDGPKFCHHPAALPSASRVHQAGWGGHTLHRLHCPDCGQFAEALDVLPVLPPTLLPTPQRDEATEFLS